MHKYTKPLLFLHKYTFIYLSLRHARLLETDVRKLLEYHILYILR